MHLNSPFIRTPLALAIGSLIASVSFNALAADDAKTSDNDNTQEVVKVWATKISNDSSLLTDDIEAKQADHLSDLLRDQPGIDVGGSHSTVQSLNVRGVDESDLDITIDGVTQANNMFHHTGNLLINADILKAVDIQLGTNSVLTNGLSGGVAFETKDAKDLLRPGEKFGARLHGNYGSNDYFASSVTLYSQLNDQFDAMAYYTLTDKNNPDNGDGDTIEGNEGKIKDGVIKLGWDINDTNRVELSYDKYKDKGDYYLRSNFGSSFNVARGTATQEIEYTRETMSLAYEIDHGDALNLRSTFYNNKIEYAPSSTSSGISEHTGFKVLAESNLTLAEMNHDLRYGLDGNHQTSYKDSSTSTGQKDRANSFAMYAEDDIQLAEGFYLKPGVRFNYYNVDMYSTDSVEGLDKTYQHFTFGLASRYLLNDQWTVKASSTQLFKGPELRESFVKGNTSIDQDVKAETGLNNEVGVAFQDNDLFWMDRVGFSTNLFRTHIKNYIQDWASGKGEYTNDGDYTIHGFESELSARKGNLSARLTYSHSNSRNDETGESLLYEVGDSISFGLNYLIPEYDLTVNWTTMMSLDLKPDTDDDTFKEGYDVHDISVTWMPEQYDRLSVTAGVENIFNELYYSQASYTSGSIKDYEPGRNVKVSVAYTF
ncbi:MULTISPECIES: TonB-dependent receptor domain-containing protein [Vibrio]|uniref:TonB-dependent receptor n=2 Tax=Vibrio TaxID=662 RepID=A0A7X4LLP3_9VIBR|nr:MULTISPECIES: TonB-dependent receptor [Vibrio]MBF9000618.1 TonB-dependent receptor [Vibrio nitrifigilis]MZI93856.1 TonB-dependent receptor [Vibrio eleionomae]